MNRRICSVIILLAAFAGPYAALAQDTRPLNLSQATVIAASPDPLVSTAAGMLQDEIKRRAGIQIGRDAAPAEGRPSIVLGIRGAVAAAVAPPSGMAAPPDKSDGFAICSDSGAGRVYVIGHDARGVLFGVGRLIRLLDLEPGRIELADGVAISTAPQQRIRGHQIGYREAANTYDAWTIDTYEQYIRDLIIFGTNSVELITSLDPAFKEGKVMARSQWEMNVEITKLLKRYGLDVWFWMPLEGDVRDPKVAQQEVDDRAKFFDAAAEITDIMVPGGDPGHTEPIDLFPWLEKMRVPLQARFPHAGIWISNQRFRFGPDESDIFMDYICAERPKGLRGLVYGPRSPGTVQETRARLPKDYLLRTYPDITHSLRCQFPVPQWDRLFSQTLDRESPNPRPEDQAVIFRVTCAGTDGFVSYSDGVNDDLNKMLWSALGWDPDANIDTILEDYGRVFFGRNVAQDVARGLRMLERNWRGSPLENAGIEETLALWEEIGAKSEGRLDHNWRYHMYLFRALFDAHVRERGRAEQEYEKEAYAALSRAPQSGVTAAIDGARAALAKADSDTAGAGTRKRMFELGPILLEEIGYQLSMDPPYNAKSPERGAMLDKVDMPLNDRLWLEAQFKKILDETDPHAQLAMVDTLVNWENPGPGGFYDDLGRPGHQPHVVGWAPYEEDPGFVKSALDAFYRSMSNETKEVAPLKYSWLDYVEMGGTSPLRMKYDGLDPQAQYRVRVTYHSRYKPELRLVAGGKYKVHGPMTQPDPVWPLEFDVPKDATASGTLELEWQLVSGRAVQVPEVWLIKTESRSLTGQTPRTDSAQWPLLAIRPR